MNGCKKTEMLTKAIKKAGGGKVQTSSDTARKLAKEMGGMKKGGAASMPREGISTRPTGPGGRRITMKDLERSNRDTGGMSAAEIKAAGEAIKRGNRTPYEPIPKKAKGGMLGKVVQAAAKPANGMLSKVAQANQGAAKPAGGMLTKVAQVNPGAVKPVAKPAAQPIGRVVKVAPPAPVTLPRHMELAIAKSYQSPNPVKAPADRLLARQEGSDMKPIKRAKGGAGKVRKGMMSETGDIRKAVKPKKGIGGIM